MLRRQTAAVAVPRVAVEAGRTARVEEDTEGDKFLIMNFPQPLWFA